MKRLALLTFILASFVQAAQPTQIQLDRALERAERSWGMRSDSGGIKLESMGTCAVGDKVAWTRFATREIVLNSECKWSRGYLDEIVRHEVGHLLTGQGHSQDRHSVMFSSPVRVQSWQFLDKPRITRADRELAHRLARSVEVVVSKDAE